MVSFPHVGFAMPIIPGSTGWPDSNKVDTEAISTRYLVEEGFRLMFVDSLYQRKVMPGERMVAFF